eukprot:CAMPEP_0198152922 /NCGR_PEP_ID=MMETSP1443-20131203/61699_1 /TAXON_ID=186043 /ORGANISM="Entomoneis sp., Strain CCMP2396" /LENGTH=59 /DNA_ID=CAMNT_0043819071 /DNA_START=8 /DNA_END=187 /DNA_ORIENTATION=+
MSKTPISAKKATQKQKSSTGSKTPLSSKKAPQKQFLKESYEAKTRPQLSHEGGSGVVLG